MEGAVVRVAGADTVPVAETRVVLHRLDRRQQGPLDSTVTTPSGRFGFRFTGDTQALYLLSARHGGIEYFSEPIRAGGPAPARIRIVVSDTSSVVPVVLAARFLLAGGPGEDTARTVLDVLVLENRASLTRVARDALSPTWTAGRLPTSAGSTIEDGTEFSPDAISLRNDSLLLFAPVSPGRKQIVLGHRLPLKAEVLRIPMDVAADTVTVLGEEPGLRVSAPGLREAPAAQIEQQAIRQWTGSVQPGEVITLRFPRQARDPGWIVAAFVALITVALVAGLLRSSGGVLHRSQKPHLARAPEVDVLDQVARLDLQYKGRRAEVSPAEWTEYESRRRALVERLAAALARGSPRT